MGTPEPEARHAATYDWGGLSVQQAVRDGYPPDVTAILDVGAGWGKYRDLLPEYPAMDACEAWRANIRDENLWGRYRHVHHGTIQSLIDDIADAYDVLIFGDVLEHLDVPDAQAVIRKTAFWCSDMFVVVPYLYEQGEEHGNHYECHLQPDLTPDVMRERYPQLHLVAEHNEPGHPPKGLYRKVIT